MDEEAQMIIVYGIALWAAVGGVMLVLALVADR